MDISQLVTALIKLFSAPRDYWQEAADKPGDLKSLLLPQMLILAAVPAVSHLLGGLVGGVWAYGGSRFLSGLLWAVIGYPLYIGIWIGFGYVLDFLRPKFGGQRDIEQSMKLATGSVIPMWLGSILHVTGLAGLGWLGALAGLGYGCYVLFLGIPVLTSTPQEKTVAYAVSAAAILVFGTIFIIGLPLSFTTCVATASLAYP